MAIIVNGIVSDLLGDVFANRGFVYRVRVESWLGATQLDGDVPVSVGAEEGDRTLRIPDRVTLTVPRMSGGFSYAPTYARAPLAANGQQLRVLLGVDTRPGHTEWIQRGWYVIQDSEADGDTVSVTAVGKEQLLDEARFVSPFQPTGTFKSVIRKLIEPAIAVDLSAAPSDRSVPSSIQFSDNRLDAVNQLLDAWPARGYVNSYGNFRVVADSPPSVSGVLRDDTYVTRVSSGSSRDNAYNCAVVQGTASDGGVVWGVAYDTSGGEHDYAAGLFNKLPVPYFQFSPLLATKTECTTAAATVLARLQREARSRADVEMVLDPTVQLGDRYALSTAEVTYASGTIETLYLPYTPDAGPMRIGLRSDT